MRVSSSSPTDLVDDIALVFGATGTLGSALVTSLLGQDVSVIRAAHRSQAGTDIDTVAIDWGDQLSANSLHRVIWAHGLNSSDDLEGVTSNDLKPVLDANVYFIVDSLHELLRSKSLAEGASLVVVSSVWERLARPGKISYTTSKAAVGGLVRSLASELGDRGMRINAVLPGVVDTPMTRQFLSPETIERVEEDTPGRHLVSADAVAGVCSWLSGPASRGINGQSIVVDGGWSVCRRL
jgi:3-oxoacyl-[acyl-carrier protein] reductase